MYCSAVRTTQKLVIRQGNLYEDGDTSARMTFIPIIIRSDTADAHTPCRAVLRAWGTYFLGCLSASCLLLYCDLWA